MEGIKETKDRAVAQCFPLSTNTLANISGQPVGSLLGVSVIM